MHAFILFFSGIFFFTGITAVCGADSLRLSIILPQGAQDLLRQYQIKRDFINEIELHRELRQVLQYLFDNGYIGATIDSIKSDSLSRTAFLNPDKQYLFAAIKPGNVDEGLLTSIGYRERVYRNKPFRYHEVARLMERILTWCENNGYPFASAELDSVTAQDGKISASLNLNKYNEVKIDSFRIKGDAAIAPSYLYMHTGIKPGGVYNEERIRKLDKKLSEIPFLRILKPSQVIFTAGETKVIAHCSNKKASVFNGILGILPNNRITGKVLLTGDVTMKFINSFHRGESLNFTWKKYQENNHTLKANFNYPWFLNTPFAPDFKFGLYRKDTSYIDVNYGIAAQYLFSATEYIQATAERKQSNLISTSGLDQATVLPPYADTRMTLYGVGFRTERLDYRFNPRKGFSLVFNGSAGNKIIKKNIKVNQALYEGMDLSVAQYLLTCETDGFIPLYRQHVLNVGIKGGYLYSKNIFLNELFRIGGLKLLRGFDEESILATAYTIGTLEYRFLMEQNSYLFVFADGAYYENRYMKALPANTASWLDRPAGFGAGISFETKAGIFSISYAVGRQFNNPLEFRQAKIHFGLVNYF